MSDYRNRIKGLEYVKAGDLTAHPGNWRDHQKAQAEALRGVLQVDYRPFKNNRLRLKPDVVIPEGINNYGIVLTKDPIPIDEVVA